MSVFGQITFSLYSTNYNTTHESIYETIETSGTTVWNLFSLFPYMLGSLQLYNFSFFAQGPHLVYNLQALLKAENNI